NLDIGVQIGGTPQGEFRYGAMLWKKTRPLEVLMEHDGTKAGLDLLANGQALVEGFVFMGVGVNNVDKTVAQDRLEGMVGQGNGAVGITGYVSDTSRTLTLSTSGLGTGEYYLYTAVWQNVSTKIIAFNQTTVNITAPPPPPPTPESSGGGGGRPPPPGVLYRYINVESEGTEGTEVVFEVSRSWLEEHDVNPATVNLYKYAQRWIRMEPEVVAEDEDFVYYSRTVLGSGRLAITGVAGSGYTPPQAPELVAAAPSEVEKPAPAPPITVQAPKTTALPVTALPRETAPPPGGPPIPGYVIFLLALIVIAAAAALAYLLRRRGSRPPPKAP
ncbi:MAG: TIGR04279 domain-containing protein, partial [Euryarchaeota archaeon]|nr:TIGR04279 domain-containing protein [Euryarchaeota archaeon]